jgi:predicted HTH domain antitoxin
MTVVIEMTPEAEELLRAEWGDLNRAAREALVIESYRQAKLSLGQCSSLLGLSVVETEAFFRDRCVAIGLTMQDVDDDVARLKRIVP